MAYLDNLLAIGRAAASARAPALVRRRRRRPLRDLRVVIGAIAPDHPVGRADQGQRRAIRRSSAGWSIALVIGGLLYLGWQILRWQNEEFVVTSRRVLQTEGVVNKRVDRQLAREDQRRDPDRVDLRPDVRLRRPRDPDGVRESGSRASGCSAEADDFKRTMLDAKHELELELSGARPMPGPAIRTGAPLAAAAGRPRRRRARRTGGPGGGRDVRRRRRRGPSPASPTCATAARSAPRSTRRRRPISCAGCRVRPLCIRAGHPSGYDRRHRLTSTRTP